MGGDFAGHDSAFLGSAAPNGAGNGGGAVGALFVHAQGLGAVGGDIVPGFPAHFDETFEDTTVWCGGCEGHQLGRIDLEIWCGLTAR